MLLPLGDYCGKRTGRVGRVGRAGPRADPPAAQGRQWRRIRPTPAAAPRRCPRL